MKLYYLSISITTTVGFLIIFNSFLMPKRKKWGWILFPITFCLHDFALIYIDISNAPIIKYIMFCVFYILSFILIRCFFQGNGVNNFIWIFGANFIYQAIATVVLFITMVLICDFDFAKMEEINLKPLFSNYIIMLVSVAIGVIVCRLLMKILLKRNNRTIQLLLGLLAMVGILAEANNNVGSLYIVFPLSIIVLVAGMLYQDKMLRVAEKQENYYHQLEERQRIRQEELAKIRHDIANHINIIDSTGSTEYAREVLGNIEREIKGGDPIVDCLLDERIRTCKEKGIIIHEEMTNLSGSIISNFDWVSLLANLLDNAIEACERFDGEAVSGEGAGSDKVIHLNIKRNKDYALVSMDNSKNSEERPLQNKFKTSKGKGHGYGTRIITDIVEKYQGRIRYEDAGNQLFTYITMKAW